MNILNQSMSDVASPPEESVSPDFYGDRPGLDVADLWNNPVVNGAGSALGGALEILDTPGRGVRTLLGTGDAGQAWDALWDPGKATSATDLRRQYLFEDQNQGEGLDVGDVIDFAADTITGILPDPLSYVTFGATGAGQAARKASTNFLEATTRGAQEAKSLAREAGKHLGEAEANRLGREAADKMVSEAREKFFQTTGRAIPDNPALLDQALNPSWYQQVRQGEMGLKVGLPFGIGGLETNAVKLPVVGQALAMAANPIEAGIETVVKPGLTTLAKTTPGMWVAKKAQAMGNLFRNPSIRSAFGSAMKYSEDVAANEAELAIQKTAKPVNDLLVKAGVKPEDWHLVEDLQQAYSPEARIAAGALNEGNARSFVNHSEANKALQAQFDDAAKQIASLPVEQRAAIYSASEVLRNGYDEALKIAQRYDPDFKAMGHGFFKARDEAGEKLAAVRARLVKEEAAAEKNAYEPQMDDLWEDLNGPDPAGLFHGGKGREVVGAGGDAFDKIAGARLKTTGDVADVAAAREQLAAKGIKASGGGAEVAAEAEKNAARVSDADKGLVAGYLTEPEKTIKRYAKNQGISESEAKAILEQKKAAVESLDRQVMTETRGAEGADEFKAWMKEQEASLGGMSQAQKLEALRAQEKELAAEYAQAKAMADRVPSYSPGVLSEGVKEQKVDRAGMRSSGLKAANVAEKSFTDADGIPLTNRQIVDMQRKGVIGTRLTGFEVPKEAIPVTGWVKGMLTKEGREAMKAAGKTIDIFSQNPVESARQYFSGAYKKAIGQNALNRSLAETYKTIPATAWGEAVKMADNGSTYAEIREAFTKKAGIDIESVLPKEAVAGLKNGTIKPAQALTSKGGLGDGAFELVEDFVNGEGHFVPRTVAQKLALYRQSSQARLGDTLSAIAAPYQAFLSVWKPLQVMFPSSQVRNAIGDLFRMFQTGTIDGNSAGDMARMFSRIKGGAEALNSREFAFFADMPIDAGGMMYRGQPITNMKQLAQAAAERGVISTGRTAEVLAEEARREGHNALRNRLGVVGGAIDGYQNLLLYKENVNRLSAFAARLRAGDDIAEASLRVEEALYNQKRISPAANFLRQTGIAPFISWTAKNVPAQVEWAVTHPGQFAAMMRGYELLTDPTKNAGMPEEAVPKYLKDKYNIVLNRGKDGKWEYFTDAGTIPLNDMTQLMKNPASIMEQLGPAFKIAAMTVTGQFESGEKRLSEELPNALLGAAETRISDLGGAIDQARGLKTDKRTGLVSPTEASYGALGTFFLNQVSPAKVKELDVNAQIEKNIKSEKTAFGKLKTAYNAAQQVSAQADLMQLDPETRQTVDYQLAVAKAKFEKAQLQHDRKIADFERARRDVKALQLAP